MFRPNRLLVAALASTLVVAACGSSGGDAKSGTSTTSSGASGEVTVVQTDDGSSIEVDSGETKTDFGVTDDVIRIGLSPDLSSELSGIATPVTDAQLVFWDTVNAAGGIAGRMIEPVVLDNALNVEKTGENYATFASEGADGVVMISHVTGSPQNAAISEDARDDDMVVVPHSWYSGWADPDFGGAQFELYANYCIEAMNGVEFLQKKVEAGEKEAKLAVLSYPGEYGQDGAAGAKLAADALGIEIVFDGEAQVSPGGNQTDLINQLVDSEATIVWIAAGPADLGAIFGGAVVQGFDAFWSGNSPTYNPALLGGDLGPKLDQFYTHSTYSSLFGSNDTAGMQDMIAAMSTERPDDLIQDVYVRGWTEGMFAKAVLEQAESNGDMTRAGVFAAAGQVDVDFQGLAPNQNWTGDPNDYVVRETYMYAVDLAAFNQVRLSDYAALDDTSTAGLGLTAVEGFAPFTSVQAASFEFTQPCFIEP